MHLPLTLGPDFLVGGRFFALPFVVLGWNRKIVGSRSGRYNL